MNSKEIRAAIDRLKATPDDSLNNWNNWAVVTRFMNVNESGSFRTPALRDKLIDLLEMADPDTHIELPRDADGKTVHIGDMMECDRLPNGCRVCGEVNAIGDGVVWLHNVKYAIHADYLHHHAKTLDEVLRECCDAYHAAALDEEGDTVMADVLTPSQVLLRYVTEIREVVANESR
jgi:hypothetical protein